MAYKKQISSYPSHSSFPIIHQVGTNDIWFNAPDNIKMNVKELI